MSLPFKRWCDVCRNHEFNDAVREGTNFLYCCHTCGGITGGTGAAHASEFEAAMSRKREKLNESRQKGWANLRRRWNGQVAH